MCQRSFPSLRASARERIHWDREENIAPMLAGVTKKSEKQLEVRASSASWVQEERAERVVVLTERSSLAS